MNQFPINVKKGALACTIEEIWHLVLSRPLTCGQKYKRTVRFRTGVVQEQREDLESTIKGSFGLNGISNLESTISAKSGSAVKFEKSKEIEETIEVDAPKNGRHLLRYYQKKQLFHFVGVESRCFTSEPWFLTVERGLEQYRDDSRRWEIDPACAGAGDFKPEPEPDGVVELVTGDGKLTLSTPYRVTDEGIVLTNFGLNTEANITQLMNSRTTIPRGLLPPHIQAIGTKDDGDIEAFIAPYQPLFSSGTSFVQRPEIYQQGHFQPAYGGLFPGLMYGGVGPTYGIARSGALPYAGSHIEPLITQIMAPEFRTDWEDRKSLPFVSFKVIGDVK